MVPPARSIAGVWLVRLVPAGLFALLAWLALSLALPQPAAACGITDVDDCVSDWIQDGIDLFLKTLFGTDEGEDTVTANALVWLFDMPEFAGMTDLHALRSTMDAVSFAMLGLVLTTSSIRLAFAGLSDAGGGGEVATGLVQTITAALMILAWPWVFEAGMSLTDTLTYGLLHTNDTFGRTSDAINDAINVSILTTSAGIGIVGLVVMVLALALVMGLVAMKIVLIVGLAIVYVLMPFVIVLRLLPGFRWIGDGVGRATGVLFIWPVIQLVPFMVFLVLNNAIDTNGDEGGLIVFLVDKCPILVALFVAVKVPFKLVGVALSALPGTTGGGGWGKFLGLMVFREGISAAKGGYGGATKVTPKRTPKGGTASAHTPKMAAAKAAPAKPSANAAAAKGAPAKAAPAMAAGSKAGPKPGPPKPPPRSINRQSKAWAAATATKPIPRTPDSPMPALGGLEMGDDTPAIDARTKELTDQARLLAPHSRPDADDVRDAMHQLGPDAFHMVQARQGLNDEGKAKIRGAATHNAAHAEAMGLTDGTSEHFMTVARASEASARKGIDGYVSDLVAGNGAGATPSASPPPSPAPVSSPPASSP